MYNSLIVMKAILLTRCYDVSPSQSVSECNVFHKLLHLISEISMLT